jgi:hypothetical protein
MERIKKKSPQRTDPAIISKFINSLARFDLLQALMMRGVNKLIESIQNY